MADDRKIDPAASKDAGKDIGKDAGAAGKTSATPPGAPGIRREPPIIEGKATEVPPGAATPPSAAKPDSAKPDSAKSDAIRSDAIRSDAAKSGAEPDKSDALKPGPSHVRPAAPTATGPSPSAAKAPASSSPTTPTTARAHGSGVSGGVAALLGGVAGAALAIAASFLLNRGDPELARRMTALEQQARATPVVDTSALTRRLSDLETQAKALDAQGKTLAAQSAGAADASKTAGQAAADSAGLARQAQGLAAAAAQTGEANKVAIAALPKPTAAPDLAPILARLDQAEKAFAGAANDARAAQAAAAERIARLEARPVVSLDRVDARLVQLEQVAAAVRPLADRIAAVETGAREAQGKLEARLASIETATIAATATVQKTAAAIDERVARNEQALSQTGQQIARTGEAVAAADQGLAQAGQRIGALETRVKGIDLKPLADRIAALDGRFAPVESRLAETGAAVAGAATRAAATLAQSQATRSAVASDAILRALGAGRPYAAELATLESVGVKADALAPLKPFAEKGAPTGAALAGDFASLSDAVAVAGAPKPGESSFGDRLLNAAGRIVKVRRIGDSSATDATSLAGRIEDSLQRGDIADAMKAFAALPEASRAAATAFGEKLAARARADEAARALSREAYAALAQPKN